MMQAGDEKFVSQFFLTLCDKMVLIVKKKFFFHFCTTLVIQYNSTVY